MTSNRGRRERGAAVGNVPLFAAIDPEMKAKIDAIADLTKLSLGQVMEKLIGAAPDVESPKQATTKRRGRGKAAGFEALAATIPAASKAKLGRLRAARGVSEAAMVENLIRDSSVDRTGYPSWWNHQTHSYQQELPYKQAI